MIFDQDKWANDINANGGREFQICSKTVMDTISDPLITFDDKGISNYYYEYQRLANEKLLPQVERDKKLSEVVKMIKDAGKGKKYDCITGVSGGVDSTYLLLQAKKFGLRPLVVHFDNGWNSELAVMNIENSIKRLGFDLYTLVVDWNEFRDIQLSYFKANVVDIEAITDHAILGTLYKLANQQGLKYILSGNNVVTEGILPKSWIFNKADGRNIVDIHNQFGEVSLKTFPLFSSKKKRYYMNVKKIQTIEILNYLDYNKSSVKTQIAKELGWRDYGGKHYESVFTRFYQGYILPRKFGIDKRKAHLSTLICSGQISRGDALLELQKDLYDEEVLKVDKEFVLKKLGFSDQEFELYINSSRREHIEFDHEKGIWDDFPVLKPLRPAWRVYKSLKNKLG